MIILTPRRYGGFVSASVPPPVLNLTMRSISGGTVVDSSGNGYNFTIDGAPNSGVALMGANGIQLVSSGQGLSRDRTTCPKLVAALSSKNFSISVVAGDDVSVTPNPQTFVAWSDSLSGNQVVATRTGKVGFGPYGIICDSSGNRFGMSAPDAVSWPANHLFVRDSVGVKQYINGVLVDTRVLAEPFTVAPYGSESHLQIGGHLNYPSSYQWLAKIRDFIVFEEALSAAQALSLSSRNGIY